MELDHVPFAWRDLDAITETFEALGLAPDYGGVHDNGVTHMSVLGFDDRSYLELIAERSDGEHDFWPTHIQENAGPAAWCVRVPDIVAECRRLLERGVTVTGPIYGSRERDDGTLVEWDRAEFGETARRLQLPFAIEDRTPLSYRVTPSASVAGGPFSGVGQVVLAVEDLEDGIGLFREVYRFPTPVTETVEGFGTIAAYPGRPVAITAASGEPWLEDRLDRFGAGPCSVLLETDAIGVAREEYPLRDPHDWPTGRVAFFDSDELGYRLGVLDRTE